MKNQPTPSDHEVLTGLVERVTYAAQGPGPPRAVGHAAAISAGEWITASGSWVNDRTHGQQFKARFLKTSAPTSAEGIEKYLASGMIRGIGPVYAKKLVRAFADKVFDIIEAEPDRLREVEGIGPIRASRWRRGWLAAGTPRSTGRALRTLAHRTPCTHGTRRSGPRESVGGVQHSQPQLLSEPPMSPRRS